MFEYRNLSQENITKLEENDAEGLAMAGLLLVHGVEKNILTEKEALDNCF